MRWLFAVQVQAKSRDALTHNIQVKNAAIFPVVWLSRDQWRNLRDIYIFTFHLK